MIEHLWSLQTWRLVGAAVSAVAWLALFVWRTRRAWLAGLRWPTRREQERRRALDCYRPHGE